MEDGQVLTIGLFILQGFWGLFLMLLTWAMRRVLQDIEKNTKATAEVATSIQRLDVMLAGNYVTRNEMDRLYMRMGEMQEVIVTLRARDDLVRDMLKSK